VVDRDRVLPESPRRLDTDEDVPKRESGYHEVAIVHVQITRRRSPVLLYFAPQVLGQPAEPLCVASRVQASGSIAELDGGQELRIMTPGGDERVN
jgi:hypothetical protein